MSIFNKIYYGLKKAGQGIVTAAKFTGKCLNSLAIGYTQSTRKTMETVLPHASLNNQKSIDEEKPKD